MNILFLGTGTSTGVPVIGCNCEVCRSKDPRNRRLRSSILVRTAKTTLLVDSGPDLRAQALRHQLTAIDAVIYTHEHLDHTTGFDEMRAFCWNREGKLPLYAGEACHNRHKAMFAWAFSPENTHKGYLRPEPHQHGGQPFTVGDIEVIPVLVEHATVVTYGYVFRAEGSTFGYVPDIKKLPAESAPLLRNLDALAMDGLCFPQHRTHLTIDENIALMRTLAPRRGYVTHSGHRVEYGQLADYLPDFMEPAYDGLLVEL